MAANYVHMASPSFLVAFQRPSTGTVDAVRIEPHVQTARILGPVSINVIRGACGKMLVELHQQLHPGFANVQTREQHYVVAFRLIQGACQRELGNRFRELETCVQSQQPIFL